MIENIEKKENVDLSNYSTMKVGGVGKVIYFPKNHFELIEILENIGDEKFFILGNGSNILFRDEGYDGTLISLKCFDKIKILDDHIWCGAGVNLFKLNQILMKNGKSALEWSYGIPGTLGGLVYMNGGSFVSEICDFVDEIVVLEDKKVKKIARKDIKFEYRSSNLKNCVILWVRLHTRNDTSENVQHKMNYFLQQKRDKQPCDLPSLGSVFKIIFGDETIYPAKLIDNLGLKGVKIGGAEISKKHAGFIVNSSSATSQDILDLIEFVEKKVGEKGVVLEREIIVL